MRLPILPPFSWVVWLFFVCASFSPLTSAVQEPKDSQVTVWQGRIWTGNTDHPWAQSMAIQGNRILAIGSRNDVAKSAGPAARVLDVGASLITPGWIDSHVHLVDSGFHLTSVQLRDAGTREEFVRRIAAFAKTAPPGTWITGGDWDHTLWASAEATHPLPDRQWIDAVTPDHPVWIQRLDGHMALANTAAMIAAGLGEEVPDITGGEVVRDAAGRLTGIFKDNAMSLIEREVPRPDPQRQVDAIEAATTHLAAQGVTSIHHMGTWDEVEALRLALWRGRLKIRVYAFTPLSEWRRLAREIEQTGRGGDRLRIGGLKGFVDGSLGSHTAAFLDPYSDTPHSRGLLVNTPENLHEWIQAADAAGLQVAVHAIGDRANRLLLDTYQQVTQENGARDRRFRIEHAQHLAPVDIPRFEKLGVIASMQPYHAIDDGRWAEGIIGPERCRTTYAFRDLLDHGARVAFGSDWFVAPPTPVEGIYAAVTRRTLDHQNPSGWIPAQRIRVEEALRAYTIDAAYAGFQEAQVGSLEPGKLADFVVVDRDLTQVPPSALQAARVEATIVDGDVIFQAADFHPSEVTANDVRLESLIAEGDFTTAESLLKRPRDEPARPVTDQDAIQLEILRRTRYEYSLSEDDILKSIRAAIPQVTTSDLARWRQAGVLDFRQIDGREGYFRRAVSNLYRFSEEARSMRQSPLAPGKNFPLTSHLEQVLALADAADGPFVFPVKHHIRYELSVPAGHPRLRAGAHAVCWLPFPQEYRQQRDVRLISCGPAPGKRSTDSPHQTICLEQKVTDAAAPLKFWVEFEYTSSAYCPMPTADQVRPYNVASPLYREFTAQRPPHIVITPEVARLAAEIIGTETNPLEQARAIFHWVSREIPWCAEIEYSTIPNLSAKGLTARRGDCGVQGMTFITLCRAAGIPARWQSGWQTKPDNWDLHDWSEIYVEPWGWLPVDASYGVQQHKDSRVSDFYFGNIDPYRMIVNLDYGQPLDPPKVSFRSEPNDFQRGEIEIDGHNLYFDEWSYDASIVQSSEAEK